MSFMRHRTSTARNSRKERTKPLTRHRTLVRWVTLLGVVGVLVHAGSAAAAAAPQLTQRDATTFTTQVIVQRLHLTADDPTIRYIDCRRRSAVTFRCEWLAGGDTRARWATGAVTRRSRTRATYVFRVKRGRLEGGRTVVTGRARWAGNVYY